MKKQQLPEGVQDFLPRECRFKREVEHTLRSTFAQAGFQEVETPAFEYYDTFAHGVGAYMQETMIKFFDRRGRILVLRPDLTVPIARMAGTSLPEEEVLRLFYVQNAFGVNDVNFGQRSEYTQAGVEYIGRAGSGADAETIALAIASMLAIGIRDFKLDIGQVGFFKGIADEAGIDGQTAEELRMLIDMKNNIELEYALSRMEIAEAVKEKLLALPDLFGGREAIERARALSDTPACAASLDNLSEVYDALAAFGYADYVTVDLGMLHKLDYYSGVVFRGVSHEIGFPILSGGRYDGLTGEFGRPRPAIGFALGVKRALIVLERQGRLPPGDEAYILVTADMAGAAAGYQKAGELRALGETVVFELGDAADRPGASAVYRCTADGCKKLR